MKTKTILKTAIFFAVWMIVIPLVLEAQVTRNGITFNTVLNAKTDLGINPGDRIDNAIKNNMADNTLIQIPPGTYEFSSGISVDVNNFGIESTTQNPDDVVFQPATGLNPICFTASGDPTGFYIGYITFDRRDEWKTSLQVVQGIFSDKVYVKNIVIDGWAPENTDAIMKWGISDPNGSALVDGVKQTGPIQYGDYPDRTTLPFFNGRGSKGEIIYRNIELHAASESGIYAGKAEGPIKVEDSYFKNCAHSAVRVTGSNSWVKNTTIVMDVDDLHPKSEITGKSLKLNRGIWVQSADVLKTGPLIEGCTIIMNNTAWNGQGVAGILGNFDTGGPIIRNTYIENNDDGAYAILISGENTSKAGKPYRAIIDNVTITGTCKNKPAILLQGRDGSIIKNSCIEMPNTDGILIDGTQNCTVENTNIKVGGQPIVEENSPSVETTGITYNKSCNDESPETNVEFHTPGLIENAGFESVSQNSNIPDGWIGSNLKGGKANIMSLNLFEIDPANICKEGSKAIQLTGVSVDDEVILKQSYIEGVAGGKWYTMQAFVQAYNATGNSVYRVYWYDSSDQILEVDELNGKTGHKWAKVSKDVKAPDRAAKVTVELRNKGLGSSCWDKIVFEQLPEVEVIGPMSFRLSHRNGAVDGNKFYVVSEKKINLGVIDLNDNSLIKLEGLKGGTSLATTLHSNGKIYIGVAGIAEYDLEKDEIRYLNLPVKLNRIDEIVEDEDGILFISGVGSSGTVYRYNPLTEELREVISFNKKYIMGLDVQKQKIYAGIGPTAEVYEVDKVTGESKQILPEEYLIAKRVTEVVVRGDRIFIELSRPNLGIVLDAKTYKQINLVDMWGGGVSDPDKDNRVYYTADLKLHWYDLDDDSYEAIDMGGEEVETSYSYGWANIDHPDFPGKTLVGVSKKRRWEYNPQSGAFRYKDTPMPSIEWTIQNLELGPDGMLYGVAYMGNSSWKLDPNNPYESVVQLHGTGQAEDIATVGDLIFFGTYTDAKYKVQDINEPWSPQDVFNFTDLDQNRPFNLLGHEGKLYTGTISQRGVLGGVFAIYDPETGKLKSWRNLSQDQSISAISVKGKYAYIGTTISGGLGSVPTTTEGKIVVFNLDTEEVENTFVPLKGRKIVADLLAGTDGNIWGMSSTEVFIMDPKTYEVLDIIEIEEGTYSRADDHLWGYSQQLWISRDGEKIRGTSGLTMFEIDPETKEVTELYSGQCQRPVEDLDGRIWFLGGGDKTKLIRLNK